MRGDDQQQDGVFSYISLEQRVPQDHPLRAIRPMVDEGAEPVVNPVRPVVRVHGTAVDGPGEAVAGAAAGAGTAKRSERLLMRNWITACCFAGLWV